MNITIDGDNLLDIEEKILTAADDIRERRQLLSEGCTCDLTKPAVRRTGFGDDGRGPGRVEAMRCTRLYALCETRKRRVAPGVFGPTTDTAASGASAYG